MITELPNGQVIVCGLAVEPARTMKTTKHLRLTVVPIAYEKSVDAETGEVGTRKDKLIDVTVFEKYAPYAAQITTGDCVLCVGTLKEYVGKAKGVDTVMPSVQCGKRNNGFIIFAPLTRAWELDKRKLPVQNTTDLPEPKKKRTRKKAVMELDELEFVDIDPTDI